MRYLGADVLRADTEADDAGGDSAKKWNGGKQPDGKGWAERPPIAQYTRNNPPLHRHLQPLGNSRG